MTGKDERKEEVISGPGFILKEKPESENKKKEELEEQKKRFKKERLEKEGREGAKTAEKEEAPKRETKDEQVPLPEITFSTFILSLFDSALMHLGIIPDPLSKEHKKSLPLAKQTIDLIGMLKDKTKGNLSKDEETLIDRVLYDLRIKYVAEVEKSE